MNPMKNVLRSVTVEIPLLGDTTCPWFDPLWLHVVKTQKFRICTDPHGPSRDTSSGLKHLERQIDLDNVEVVAAHAGKKGVNQKQCWFQEVLIREGNVWSVLNRQAHSIELRLLFDSDDSTKGPADVVPEREQYVCHIATLPSIFVDEESNNSTGEFQEQRRLKIREYFRKDPSYLKVAKWFEEREYVDSRYWPRIISKFRFLQVSTKTPINDGRELAENQRTNEIKDDRELTGVQLTNDWLLDQRGYERVPNHTLPELEDLLTKRATETGCRMLSAGSISDAMKESWRRRFPDKTWPDGRGRKRKTTK